MKNQGLEQIHVMIFGRVQGVGFRHWIMQQAKIIGVSGWVKNNETGTVEAFAEGSPLQISHFLKCCGVGPRGAEVTEIKTLKKGPITSLSHSTFDRR